jgi:hypothetical protein
MTFTIVYVDDDMNPACYGTFRTREAAEARADRMNDSLDVERDIAGGGAGLVAVCSIQPLRTWSA